MTQILVVNAGSTNIKLHLVDHDGTAIPVGALDAVDPGQVTAIAHRVVHGGPRFRDPVIIDALVRAEIFALEGLAPIHNAPALRAIEDAERLLPDLPQIGVFDTGFHATMPAAAASYALPAHWREDWGIHRYGFHGLSVQWSAQQVRVPRLVVCHLGGGCSVTAVADGRSVDTTMGFSPLDGLPMATRSGSVDPQALIYILRSMGLGIDELEHELNFGSGLLGLGGSADMRDIEAGGGGLALDVFVHRLAAAIAAMTASLGGLDALVFTAGIGEGSATVRERVCARLGFLGVALDRARNAVAVADCEIAGPGAPVRVHVIHAREELIAARLARRLLANPDDTTGSTSR
jgi:acetate kinase